MTMIGLSFFGTELGWGTVAAAAFGVFIGVTTRIIILLEDIRDELRKR
jgi:hypothetical protein